MYNRPDGISHRKSSRVERRTTRSKSTSWWSPAWAGVEGATVPRKRRGPGDPQRQEQPDQERCDHSKAPTGCSRDSLEIATVSREYFQHLPCTLTTLRTFLLILTKSSKQFQGDRNFMIRKLGFKKIK